MVHVLLPCAASRRSSLRSGLRGWKTSLATAEPKRSTRSTATLSCASRRIRKNLKTNLKKPQRRLLRVNSNDHSHTVCCLVSRCNVVRVDCCGPTARSSDAAGSGFGEGSASARQAHRRFHQGSGSALVRDQGWHGGDRAERQTVEERRGEVGGTAAWFAGG